MALGKKYGEDFKITEEEVNALFAPFLEMQEEQNKVYQKITNESFKIWLKTKIYEAEINGIKLVYSNEEGTIQDEMNAQYLENKVDEYLKLFSTDWIEWLENLRGDEYMFTEWLSAFTFEGNNYIAERIYGQGETMFSIEPASNHEKVKNFLDLDAVIEYIHKED